jgi:NAD(P)-dependent dehydrogenase (short-subunit alcohol dehydrogenase family)
VTPDALRNPLSLFDLSGQVVVITGASGALGRAAAIALGAVGARLLLASGSASGLAEVAEVAKAASGPGGEVATLARRPDSQADADAILAAAIAAYGQVDSVFVASGLNKPAPIEDMAYEDWQAIMDANVRGPWLMAKSFGQHLAGREQAGQAARGKLLLVSSVRGRHGSPAGYSAYCTSKGATDSLTKTLATEWGPRGINVNAIAPAVFRSALTTWIFADTEAGRASRERNLTRISLKRLGEPEDFIGIVLYLLSAASDFVTGQVIYVDGGYTAA